MFGQYKKIILAITNVFETGTPKGDYDALAVLPDGAGISYGRSQVTDRSGSLDHLLYMYRDSKGKYADELWPYMDQLDDPLCPLASNGEFKAILKKAGSDPIMCRCQDALFEEKYWIPSKNLGEKLGVTYPLCFAILYDISIQSGIGRIARLRRRFPEMPPVRGGTERPWALALARARFNWISNYTSSSQRKQKLVRSTAWRSKVFVDLAEAENWKLELPIKIRSVVIEEEDL